MSDTHKQLQRQYERPIILKGSFLSGKVHMMVSQKTIDEALNEIEREDEEAYLFKVDFKRELKARGLKF